MKKKEKTIEEVTNEPVNNEPVKPADGSTNEFEVIETLETQQEQIKNVSLQVNGQENAVVKFDAFDNVNEMLVYADTLINSKLIPTNLKTPEAVVAVIILGKELGFKPMVALTNLNNIQGKVTLGVHAIGALLRKRNIAFRKTQDYEKVYNEDGKHVDYVTTFRFMYKWEGIIIENDFSYFWSDAVKAGLATKDNWQKQPRTMMRTRSFSGGARMVAPDVLLGIYETSEWADVENVPYDISEDMTVKIK